MKKPIKNIYLPVRDDIADLRTVRALPNPQLQHLDPFLFLNHHGHQIYAPNNQGLPFGPHPHRGFETVTFVLKGDISHRDSAGHESVIDAGGIQWMTAGKGIVHSEVSSEKFKKNGGELEILQLWLNLPSQLKMTEPKYIGLEAGQIPHISLEGVTVNLMAGEFAGTKGPVKPLIDVTLMSIEFKKNSQLQLEVRPERNIFFYVVSGQIIVNGKSVSAPHLVEFENSGNEIQINAELDSFILFGHAEPFNEPIVSYGPFVMNTREEILRAIKDFS